MGVEGVLQSVWRDAIYRATYKVKEGEEEEEDQRLHVNYP
jgi:hypothetical protein